MKKNKGFTLIELLAVIVILAIIALIATPIITGQLDQVRASAFLRSANSIVHAAELKYANLNNDTSSLAVPYNITFAGGALVGPNDISFKGKRPDEGLVTINTIGQVAIILWNNDVNKCVTKAFTDDSPSFNETVTTKEACQALIGGGTPIVYSQVIDTNSGVICGSTATEDYAGNAVCNINSVEDLVAFSNLAKTQNFSGKTINLNTNLDITDNVSYMNPATISLGNINGDGLTEGLKVELGKANGFYPIGSTTMAFAGTFNGNGYIINHVMIKGSNYVGLFGYSVNGTVKNLKLDNINVTGNGDNVGGLLGYGYLTTTGVTITNATISGANYVGGLAGYIYYKTVSSVMVQGNVTGLQSVGGIVGILNGSSTTSGVVNSAIFEGNVTGTQYVAGIVGRTGSSYAIVSNSVNKGGVITGSFDMKRIVGYNCTPSNSIALNTILVNGAPVSSSSYVDMNGYDVTAIMLTDINTYESAVDTYVGGDNDADGYYFDYAVDGGIVIKPISTLSFTLAGAGTAGDPYLITSANELKQVSLRLSSYFKLANDIDFTGINKYMLSSYANANTFSGTFDGNGKTISNFAVKGASYVGLFGYSVNGTVKNLKLDNINVTGNGDNVGGLLGYGYLTTTGVTITNATISGANYVGGLAGYIYYKTVSSVMVQGNVTGLQSVGGIVGILNGSSTTSGVVNSAIFEGNVTGTQYVAGIVGRTGSSYAIVSNSVNKGGVITGSFDMKRIVGYNCTPSNSIALNTILVNGVLATPTGISTANGRDTIASDLLLQATYTAVGFNFTDNTPGLYIWHISGSNIWITLN